MAENQLPEEVVQKLDPNRRKFLLGILAAGITAPSVASFVMGKTNKSAVVGTPIRPASIINASGNFNFSYLYSGNSYSNPSANYFYNNYSGNFLRDASGNFLLDLSGNLLCGTSGNILLDMSGNAIPSGNFAYAPHPSGNWIYDPSSNSVRIPFRDPSGNASSYYGLNLDPSGNTFRDNSFAYDSNGVINFNSNQQNPGLACVVSANHIRQIQTPPSSSSTMAPTSTTAPTSTSTSTSAPTTSSAPTTTNPGVNQNGSGSSNTTTTVPVTPVVPNGSIPATK